MNRADIASLGGGTRWRIAAAQIIGRRSEQQDVCGHCSIRLDDGEVAPVVVVADGMGGEAGGGLAAGTALRAFLAACEDGVAADVAVRLREALLAANAAVQACAESDPALAGMGCTLVALAMARGRATWISVGDSLLFRVAGDRIERINADHSMGPAFDEAARAGEMTVREAANHPQRNVLISALTGRSIALIDERSLPLGRQDCFALATDGVLGLTLTEIAAAVAIGRDGVNPAAAVAAILAAVEARDDPEQDNTTVAVAIPLVSGRRSRGTGLALVAAGTLVAAGAGGLLLRHERAPEPVRDQSPRHAPAARIPAPPPEPSGSPKSRANPAVAPPRAPGHDTSASHRESDAPPPERPPASRSAAAEISR